MHTDGWKTEAELIADWPVERETFPFPFPRDYALPETLPLVVVGLRGHA